MIDYSRVVCSGSRDLFKSWEISGDILEIAQDRHIAAIED